MEKVAIFGNAGAGKSTLAKRLAAITGLPLYSLDTIQFRSGRYRPDESDGGKLTPDAYLKLHADLMKQDRWIIDGFDNVASAWQRFEAADTLIYVDLPLPTHYWWITKRLAKGLFRTPEGWPEKSPLWSSTLSSYRVVRRCHRHLTPRYRQLVATAASDKRVHHLRTPADIRSLLETFEQALAPGKTG